MGDIAQRLAAFSPEKPVTSRGRKEIEYDDQGGFRLAPRSLDLPGFSETTATGE